MIKQFDKYNLHEVRAEINKSLSEAGERLGMKLEIGSITFGDFSFTTKMTVTIKSPEAHATLATKVPSWVSVGSEITYNGTRYRITGYNPRRQKYPVIATNISSGRSFCLPKVALLNPA